MKNLHSLDEHAFLNLKLQFIRKQCDKNEREPNFVKTTKFWQNSFFLNFLISPGNRILELDTIQYDVGHPVYKL